MTFEIRNDLPIPVATRGSRGSKYPLAHLEVGECFVVPADFLPAKGANSIRAAVSSYKKSSGTDAKFVIRSLNDGSVGVWRSE